MTKTADALLDSNVIIAMVVESHAHHVSSAALLLDGPRLYDRLIGQAAIHHAIGRIITWDVGHMRDLFPGVEVVDPLAAARR